MNSTKTQCELNEKEFSERIKLINRLSDIEQNRLKIYLENKFRKQGMKAEIIAANLDLSTFLKNPNFFNYLGDFCQNNKHSLTAITCYEKALKINPRNYWTNFHLAETYCKYIYEDRALELGIKRQRLINKTISIYDYLIAITFRNKSTLNPQEKYCLRAASYFFEQIGKDSRSVFINRILAEKDAFLSTDKFIYKPITNFRKQEGIKMNPFYEKFALVLEDKELINQYRQKYREKEYSLKNYLIAMTARSGSSWLTELIAATKLAGNPEEWFNYQDNLDGILQTYPCRNFSDYLKCIKVDQSTPNNIFGLEASFPQLESVLEGSSLEKIFGRSFQVIYLTRNNFIKQGISLYKAVSSGYYHTTQRNKQNVAIPYDNEQIKRWILHLLRHEFFWEQFFIQNSLKPFRVTYEQLIDNPNESVKNILLHIGVEVNNLVLPIQTEHQKVSNQTSEEMYEQFKQKNQEFVQLCKEYRSSENILKI